MTGKFALIPNARTAMAAVSRAPAAEGARLRLTYDVEIRGNGSPVPNRIPVTGELKGPGDVVGLNRQAIGRVEPEQGLRGFEPNYLPFLEFVDADLPWRYSLDNATGRRIRPWLALLALRPEEFEFVAQGRAPLQRIRVGSPAASLPDLEQSWAWAHVQVDLTGDAGVAETVAADPSAHFSRLFCPRRLEERTQYHLFLVPAYEAGRLAGLGSRETAAPFDAPAWDAAATEPVELPVYFQSRFTTNEMEDVETLVRRLRGVEAEDVGAGGTTTASAADPGYYGETWPGETIEVQAALRQPGLTVDPYGTPATLANKLKGTLEQVIAGETIGAGQDGPEQEDPLVAMPPYGWRFRHDQTLDPAKARRSEWFHRTNLDLKFRHAAGLGAETVRRDQELFARKCWEQYDEVVEANRRLRRLRFAEIVAERVTGRLQRLPSDAVLALTEPVHAVVRVDGERTLAAALQVQGTPSSFVGRAVRRVAAKRPIARDGRRGVSQVTTPMPTIPGDLTPDRTTRPTRRRATPKRVVRVAPAAEREMERELSRFFGAAPLGTATRAKSFALPVAEFRSTSFAAAVSGTLLALPGLKADFVVGGLREEEKKAIAPVYRSPIVPLPLADHLKEFAKDRLLPGVGSLPENSVSAFEENRAFIEAFLVGANHAMNAELRWREFPTDMRGTIFRRFWDRGRAPDDVSGDDIPAIHTWTKKLGRNFPPGTDGEADLVIVIRGDLVRKLGQLIVVLNEAESESWESGRGTDHEPVFFGRIGRDTVYYGFDVARSRILSAGVREKAFLVMYEPVGRLRFGLDVATATVRRQRLRHEKLTLPFPVGALQRSYAQVPAKLPGLRAPTPGGASTWDDLSWSHVERSEAGYIDFASTPRLPTQPDYWGADRTSATFARSLWQKPLAAVLPLARVL